MKERPILFSGPMVRAILEGRKTMTRRVIKPQPRGDFYCIGNLKENTRRRMVDCGLHAVFNKPRELWLDDEHPARDFRKSPYGQPGDRLWVRETWQEFFPDEFDPARYSKEGRAGNGLCTTRVVYRADGELAPHPVFGVPRWAPSIHMPRWASRITLELTAVRVERLQDISEEDAKAEGVTRLAVSEALNIPGTWAGAFADLWDSLYAKRGHGWDSNPWVWVESFKRVE